MNNREYAVSIDLVAEWKKQLLRTLRDVTGLPQGMFFLVPPVPMSTAWTSEQINGYLFGEKP